MTDTVALVPLYNHARTVEAVLDGIAACGLATIVVDDGSGDGGAEVAEAWFARTGRPGRVIRLGRNRGKAVALQAGFAAAAEGGARSVLSVDADGQHDTTRIPAFLAAAQGEPATLVLGNRGPLPKTYPLGRLGGRMLSGLAVRAACGVVIGDAACGMRLYPVAETLGIRCFGGRYAWEEEAIVRLAWRGVAVREVPIPVIYRDRSVAPSHYRFARDWTEGVLVLVATVGLGVVSPARRWSGGSASVRDLAWPLLRARASSRDVLRLLASMAAGVGATVGATVAAAASPVGPSPVGVATAAMLLALVVVRTRSPVVPAAVGAVAGWFLPVVLVAASLPIAFATCIILIALSRGNDRAARSRPASG